MINIYQLQNLAPVFLVLGIYTSINLKSFCLLLLIFALFYKKLFPKINRLIIFLIVGFGRSLINQNQETYTFKYTSFRANVVDYKLTENKSYLLLDNFQYVNKKSGEHNLDEYPKFPKKALMEIENIEKYQNAKTIECIGRFYLPVSFICQNRNLKIPRGKIKFCNVIEEKKNNFKHYFRQKLRSNLNKDVANFCCAIFLSDTFCISKDTRKLYQKAGLGHVLGVSVLNLSLMLIIFFYVFYYLVGCFCLKASNYLPLSIWSQIFSSFLVFLYCYALDFEYALLRSFFMSILSILMLVFSNKDNVENLLLSAALIILINPLAIYDIGFQLSFGGVLGIYSFNLTSKNRILNSFYSTIAATSLIGPISIYEFQNACIQPFLSNLIVIPFLSFILIPCILIYLLLPNIFALYFANLINFEFILLQKIVVFLSKIAKNLHFLPIFYAYFLLFLAFFLLFSIIKEPVRYYFLFLSYFVFSLGAYKAYNFKPFILVNMSCIALVLKDKIVVYPKAAKFEDFFAESYALPVIDGHNSGYFKNDCGKIVFKDIGIIRTSLKGNYSIKTKKDYVFLPSQLINLNIIYI